MTGEPETPVQGMPEQRALRYVDLSRTTFAADAAGLLPEETARRYRAVPIERRGGVTLVAVASPANPLTMEALREAAAGDVTTVVASPDQITAAIAHLYGGGSSRGSRRRGQHAAGDANDAPVFDTVRYATAEGLLADPGSAMHAGHGAASTAGSAGTLEESLRGVLVPPDAGRHLPLQESGEDGAGAEAGIDGVRAVTPGTEGAGRAARAPAPGGSDADLVGAVAGSADAAGADPLVVPESPRAGTSDAQAAGAVSGTPDVDLSGIAPPTANGAAANGATANGAAANGSPTTNGATANGATANGAAANGATANGAAANGATANGAAANGAAANGAAPFHNGTSPNHAPVEPGATSAGHSGAGTGRIEQGPKQGSAPPTPPAVSSNSQPGRVSTGGGPGSDPSPMEDHPHTTAPGGGSSGTVRSGTSPHDISLDWAAHDARPSSVPPPPPGFGSVDAGAAGTQADGGSAADPAAEAAAVHWPPLARVLVRGGKVSFDQMTQALRAHREEGESLARYLFSQKLATEEDLVQAMAEEVGLDFVDLSAFPVDPNAAALIPEAVARRHMVLALRLEDGVPVVAMANPTDVFAMDDLRSIMGRNFTPVVATRSQIDFHLRQLQESGGNVQEAAQSAAGAATNAGGGFELESLQSVVEDAPIVRYVNLLILQALNERASDIHIEPMPRRLRIRFRIDGVMHDASSASPAIHQSVISRLKVLGEMDITEHRVPQEGRVSVSVGDRQIDLRLAVLPSQYGETCVMRLLDKSASIRRLSELGFFPDTLERYAQAYNHPYGVILVTGPTGAGKTTTLYATLQEVMSGEKAVVTVEDPVEYQIDGITQVQINAKVGLQFSTALRSILRADPDIILVGEIRDIETASIAMEAALSGHLVLSTLHTNTAAGTPLRLTEMGIEPFLVTSAVGGVLTQRLARVLCERCKTPYHSSLTDFYAAGYREVDLEGLDVSTLYRAAGCRTCSHTGYHGRMLLAEVMPVTEEIERMIIEQQSIVAIERQAVEQGMRTLRQDGLRKALSGFTTLEEVLRVVV